MALKYSFGKYPGGELYAQVPSSVPKRVVVWMDITEDPKTLFQAAMLADGLAASGAGKIILVAPWIAYGRSDRLTAEGHAPAGLTVGRILSAFFDRVVTMDAHSPAFRKAFGKTLANVHLDPSLSELPWTPDIVVAPDHGAIERARCQASRLRKPLLVLSKTRKGKSVSISKLGEVSLKGKRVLIVDDIVDSGATLSAAADVLKSAGAAKICALVSHKLKSAPPRIASIDRLISAYDHSAKRLQPWARHSLEKAV